ncbi:MAG: type II toxin-antitoxin system HicB family antitoxin [Gemmatimonadetes bacterium]|nr:type II toxin-antitoxin system HicB family antitoxin [Gemmatimonadota bacterium]
MATHSDPQITLERVDDGTFVATSATLPGYVARGETEGAAIRKIRKALKLHLRDYERDFLRITDVLDAPESFRWSRYRAPLYLQLPLSRRVKLNLVALAVGVSLGLTAFGAVSARRSRR